MWWPAQPFMDRFGIVFLVCAAIAVIVSLMSKQVDHAQVVDLGEIGFSTSTSFNMATAATVLFLVAFYASWW